MLRVAVVKKGHLRNLNLRKKLLDQRRKVLVRKLKKLQDLRKKLPEKPAPKDARRNY